MRVRNLMMWKTSQRLVGINSENIVSKFYGVVEMLKKVILRKVVTPLRNIRLILLLLLKAYELHFK